MLFRSVHFIEAFRKNERILTFVPCRIHARRNHKANTSSSDPHFTPKGGVTLKLLRRTCIFVASVSSIEELVWNASDVLRSKRAACMLKLENNIRIGLISNKDEEACNPHFQSYDETRLCARINLNARFTLQPCRQFEQLLLRRKTDRKSVV